MAYTFTKWRDRHHDRVDISSTLTHLTRRTPTESAVAVLLKILAEQTIRGSTEGFIVGDRPAVCFQDAPLVGLAQNIRHEQEERRGKESRIRYEGVGLTFNKTYAFALGARPVIYDDTDTAKAFLPPSEYWRIVRLDLRDAKNMIDWTHEREWRVPGDFHFSRTHAALIVTNSDEYRELIARASAGLLSEVYAVTVLAHATA